MKMRKVLLAAFTSLTFTAAVFTTGCGSQENGQVQETEIKAEAEASQGEALADITLSVNPEISIEYDKEGKVTAVTGNNADGEGIVSAYQDYQGKDCSTVLEELINRINEAGYFIDEIDGNKKNIVIQMEPGSVLPADDFLETISRDTQEAVAGLELTSDIVTIDDDDYDDSYAKGGEPSPYITLDKAKEIALAQANVNAADAVFEDKEFDFDDGIAIYELEFTAGGSEYDREAFVYAPGNVRITLDRNLYTGLGSIDFLNTEIKGIKAMDSSRVLEVKYDEFLPELVRMAVQVPGRQAGACSKYALCRRFD